MGTVISHSWRLIFWTKKKCNNAYSCGVEYIYFFLNIPIVQLTGINPYVQICPAAEASNGREHRIIATAYQRLSCTPDRSPVQESATQWEETTIHIRLRTIQSCQSAKHAHLWAVSGRRNTWRKPTQAHWKHADSAQKDPRAGIWTHNLPLRWTARMKDSKILQNIKDAKQSKAKSNASSEGKEAKGAITFWNQTKEQIKGSTSSGFISENLNVSLCPFCKKRPVLWNSSAR